MQETTFWDVANSSAVSEVFRDGKLRESDAALLDRLKRGQYLQLAPHSPGWGQWYHRGDGIAA